MGKSSILSVTNLQMTMKFGMCDQASESHVMCNGEDDTPVIPMVTKFEDIEHLKANRSVGSLSPDHNDSTNLINSNDVLDESKSEDGVRDLCSSTRLLTCDSRKDFAVSSKGAPSYLHPSNGSANGSEIVSKEFRSYSEGDVDRRIDASIIPGVDGISSSSHGDTTAASSASLYHNSRSCSSSSHDLPIDVSSSSSARFSRVLENISLPLLYIPTTRQLVATKGNEATSPEDGEKSKLEHLTSDAVQKDNQQSNRIEDGDFQSASSASELSGDCPEPRITISRTHDSISSLSDVERLQSLENFTDITTRCDTYHLFPDNTSLSSLSTCTDFSVSAFSVGGEDNAENRSLSHVAEDAVFMDVNLHSRNSFDRSYNPLAIEDVEGLAQARDSQSATTKKKTSTFKNIFGKKVKEDSTPGWKLFGKVPPKTAVNKDPQEIKSEIEARRQKAVREKQQVPPPPSNNNTRRAASEVSSTTALILENRPENLPTKNPEEEERHRQQYIQMIEAAKKKEQKDLKQKKKRLQQQRKLEDKLMSFVHTWTSNILPNWEAARQTKKVRELWWLGLPSNVRGQVWTLAIGNDLNITHELYEILRKRAEDKIKEAIESKAKNKENPSGPQETVVSHDKEDSVNVIRLDVSRTFPHLGIFQKGGPYHDLLHCLLGAYACYRPDVGYVQGMSFIAAILLLNMEVADAFVCFANLLNRPCQLAFFRMDENIVRVQMTAYYNTFDAFFKENLPRLHAHVVHHNVTPNLYLMEWVFLLYSKSLPLDVACRVWDLFCRDGEEFLFRTAIGILMLYENVLLKMDFILMAQFLTKLPEDISSEDLFQQLEGVKMSIDKRGFNAVHAFYKDLHDPSS